MISRWKHTISAMARNDRLLDHFSISTRCFLKQHFSLHEEAICWKQFVLIEKSQWEWLQKSDVFFLFCHYNHSRTWGCGNHIFFAIFWQLYFDNSRTYIYYFYIIYTHWRLLRWLCCCYWRSPFSRFEFAKVGAIPASTRIRWAGVVLLEYCKYFHTY